MSSVSSRPKVKQVKAKQSPGAAVLFAGLAAGLVAAAAKGLGAAARSAYRIYTESLEERSKSDQRLQSIPALRDRVQQARQEGSLASKALHDELSAADKAKLEQLRALAVVPFAVENSTLVTAATKRVLQATSVKEIEGASSNLQRILEQDHHRVLCDQLVLACSNASIKVGFPTLETSRGLDGCFRVVAQDASGRSLVSEIAARSLDEEPSIRTEVVGVQDGSCMHILDRFDRALEAEGVDSAPPERELTGGVCQLAAAKRFVEEKERRLKSKAARSRRARRGARAVRTTGQAKRD